VGCASNWDHGAKAIKGLIEELDVQFLSKQSWMPWELFIPNNGCKFQHLEVFETFYCIDPITMWTIKRRKLCSYGS
jgi:hypothetical protein